MMLSYSLTIAVGTIVLLASIAWHSLVLLWHLRLNVPLSITGYAEGSELL
jgi:hypothetical protein